MADVSKIKLPNNTEVNIKDSRITGIDNTPTSGSGNVVTSGGIYDSLAAKQDNLVSGTNIKTVNNTSLLGSGNITVEDGESAYQIWLDEGNVGTVEDYLASLKGEDGIGVNSITTQQNGAFVVSLTSGDTVTVDLNHEHGDYLKYYLCEDESEYESIDDPDPTTLYLIPEE